MSLPIHLLTVAGGQCPGLPRMLEHYGALGVESFFVQVHLSTPDDPALDAIRDAAHRFGCAIAATATGNWQHVQHELYSAPRRGRPGDWFILADTDELQLYPRGLRATIEECDRRGYTHLRGCFVDRVARDGGFPPIRPGEPLWDQFPLGGFLTYPVLGADPRKVVAVKGDLLLEKGQHHAVGGRACPIRENYIQVHHFKWFAGVAERLAERAAALRRDGFAHWVESARFVEYIHAAGRFQLEHPLLLAGECDPHYPHWEAVMKIVSKLPVIA